MAECRHISKCAFYQDQLAQMPSTAEFMKVFFCHQRSEYCLRLKNAIATPVDNTDNAIVPVSQKYASPPHTQAKQSS